MVCGAPVLAQARKTLSEGSAITVRDIAERAGIHFVHNNGAYGKKYLPETMRPGVAFIDYDHDGWPDIFISNGHIDRDIQRVQPNVKYAIPPHVFRNMGKGNFQEMTKSLGAAFDSPRVGRGAAYADINNDGRLDVLVSTNGGRAYWFENNAAAEGFADQAGGNEIESRWDWERGEVDGGGRNANGNVAQRIELLVGERVVLTLGLAQHDKADAVEIRWPSGQVDRMANVAAGETIIVTEGEGITGGRKYGDR